MEDVMSHGWFPSIWSESEIREFLCYITSDNMKWIHAYSLSSAGTYSYSRFLQNIWFVLRSHVSKSYEMMTDLREEKTYGTKFKVEKIPDELIQVSNVKFLNVRFHFMYSLPIPIFSHSSTFQKSSNFLAFITSFSPSVQNFIPSFWSYRSGKI